MNSQERQHRFHARPGPYLPPDAPPESLAHLLLGGAVLVIFCAAFYSLIVGLG